jgi:solute carrier family 35, member E3
LVGTIYALLAVVSNTMYTIYGKTKQQELQCNAMQILLYQSIMSAFILMFFIPVFDDVKGLAMYAFDSVNSVSAALVVLMGLMGPTSY